MCLLLGDTNELDQSFGLHNDQQSNGSHIYLPYHNGDSMISRKFAHIINVVSKLDVVSM